MLAALLFTAIYLGGAGADDCDDITFDATGYAYLACHSSSENFAGAEKKDMDAYVVKFDPRDSKVVYATRIGGSDWDAAFRVVVDGRGAVWVSGTTRSSDFPLGGNEGGIRAFVARLNAQGAVESMALVPDATGEGLVIGPDDKGYLAGTKSPSADKTFAYVAEIDGSRVSRVLMLGPGTATGIAMDRKGRLFVAGFHGHGAFLAKVFKWTVDGMQTIGSAEADRARAVAVDRSGRPHVLGTMLTGSKSDVFIAGFDSKLKRVRYRRLFGGSAEDMAGFNGASLRLDTKGNLWICGSTRSKDLPARGKSSGLDDGFVASFSPGGRERGLATYVGGEGFEMIEGLAIAPDGAVWATGITSSRGLAEPGFRGGRSDAILVRLREGA